MITVKAPGKLYIAGEYAVVEAGHPAVLITVDQFIQVNAKIVKDSGMIKSSQSPHQIIQWHNQNHQIHFTQQSAAFSYVMMAMRITEAYLGELNLPTHQYQLSIDSDLDSHDGHKYGLGSSAAVSVAIVKAIFKLYQLPLDTLTIFKLAAIAHLKVQGNGSLGDVAASAYQGWIAYQSFDRNWLFDQLQTHSIKDVIEQSWPGLKVERLTPPNNLKLMIGWTGSPASTASLVGTVAGKKANQTNFYQSFLAQSKACVNQMIIAFHHQDTAGIQHQIKVNRQLLNQLGHSMGIPIETPRLKQMSDIVIQHGGVAKTSGAGGGDCGIALIDDHVDDRAIVNDWHDHQINKLNFKISNHEQEEPNDQPSFSS
ncbi:phosphomevalonate kinase [Nicoliella lavandulae]|uniref:phosphomevalonate kinase n=1 Tax=Nicoliella lavandulae TaxID=3082954 RepID=A0ABU8SL25_9LACO